MALQHAAAAQEPGGARRHRLRGEQVRGRRPPAAVEDHVVAGALVHDHGLAGLLQHAPQRLPLRQVPLRRADEREQQPADGRGPPCAAPPRSPWSRSHVGIMAASLMRSIAAEAFEDPVVVDPARLASDLGILDVPHVQADRRIDDLGVDEVACASSRTARRVTRPRSAPAPRAPASSADSLSHPIGLSSTTRVQPPSCSARMRRGARSRLSTVHPLVPEVVRLVDVSVGRDLGQLRCFHAVFSSGGVSELQYGILSLYLLFVTAEDLRFSSDCAFPTRQFSDFRVVVQMEEGTVVRDR